MKNLIVTIYSIIIILLYPTPSNAYYPYSPYSYCGGDPINSTDPTGCVIEGVSKHDAALAVEDFRAMFPGDEFKDFRNLIVQSGKKQTGKSFAPISTEALSAAFSGITLNEDQQALVDIVVNTINSNDVHKVEYVAPGKDMSLTSQNVYVPLLNSMNITAEMAAEFPEGYFHFVMALCGEASTTTTKTGTLTLISNQSDGFVTNRAATLGHEVMGHGRTLRLGYTDSQSQHVVPIQVENLILRNMGIPFYRDGTDHAPGKTFIPNYMSIPIIR
ncbi:MAG: hypothetical protein K2J10_11495 [Muribaculaceae bacterium]|nr:hypothetical protein [Muribaculaceae bacterium]